MGSWVLDRRIIALTALLQFFAGPASGLCCCSISVEQKAKSAGHGCCDSCHTHAHSHKLSYKHTHSEALAEHFSEPHSPCSCRDCPASIPIVPLAPKPVSTEKLHDLLVSLPVGSWSFCSNARVVVPNEQPETSTQVCQLKSQNFNAWLCVWII